MICQVTIVMHSFFLHFGGEKVLRPSPPNSSFLVLESRLVNGFQSFAEHSSEKSLFF